MLNKLLRRLREWRAEKTAREAAWERTAADWRRGFFYRHGVHSGVR
jgi:hypothetical protein